MARKVEKIADRHWFTGAPVYRITDRVVLNGQLLECVEVRSWAQPRKTRP